MAEAAAAGVAIESLTKQLRALKQELATLDPNTAKFQELAVQAGQVKDQINDASEAMNANAGSAFERLRNNAGLLQERLVSLDFDGVSQSVKSFGTSLSGIKLKDIKGGIDSMTTSVTELNGKLKGSSLKGFEDGIKSLGGSLKSLASALLKNPIFLIAAAIAVAYAAISKMAEIQREKTDAEIKKIEAKISMLKEQTAVEIAKANGNAKEIYEINKKSTHDEIQLVKEKIGKLRMLELTRQGMTDEQRKQLEEFTNTYRELLNKQEIAEINHTNFLAEEKRKQAESYNTFEKAINDKYDSLTMSARDYEKKRVNEQLRADIQLLNQTKQNQEQYKNDLSLLHETRALAIKAIDDKYNKIESDAANAKAEKRKAADKKAAEDFLKSQEEISAQILEWQNEDAAAEVAANEARLKRQEDYYAVSQFLITDAKQKEIDALVADYDARFELANGNAELEKALAEQQAKDIADIEAKYRKEKEDKDKEAADKEAARVQGLQDFKISSIQDSLNVITALTDVFNNGSEKSAKKAFALNKAASLAQAIVATYSAATKAYASQLVIGDPSSIVRAQIAAGIAVAGGLANVAKIAKTQFSGGGSGGGGSASGSGGGSLGSSGGGSMTSVTPAFNPLNTSFLNNRPAQTGAVQAYVLSSNVSSAMEANQKVKDQTVL